MEILENINLAQYSTFKIGGPAKYFTILKTKEDLLEALTWAQEKKESIFVLGAGSNSLFSDQGYSGLVIKNEIKGLEIVSEDEEGVLIRAYGGEFWSDLVNFSVENNLYGLENTFYIPGTVGAAPIQNIGAYGQEMKDKFFRLLALDLESGEERYFSKNECDLSYRNSIFKKALKGKYFILFLEFKLKRQGLLNLNYPDIQRILEERNISEPSLKELIQIIKEIRDNKLPNPYFLPSAGSFFKNSIISQEHFLGLKEKFPEVKGFPEGESYKIPSAWLIDKCGFKGLRLGAVGVYEKQALIIVNHGGASQVDVLNLVAKIKTAVKNKFNIDLEEEVNILSA